MTADAVASYIQGLLDAVQFKRSSYASRLSPSRDEPIVRGGYEAGRACRADRGMNSASSPVETKKAAHTKERAAPDPTSLLSISRAEAYQLFSERAAAVAFSQDFSDLLPA